MIFRFFHAFLLGSMLLQPVAFTSVASRYQSERQIDSRAVVSIQALPALNLDYLVETSELIVLGELVTIEETSSTGTVEVGGKHTEVRIDRGTLRIDEMLKGIHDEALVFDLVRPMRDTAWELPDPQTYGLFFFRVGEDKRITFTNPYYPKISVPRGLYSRGDTTLDRVVSILGDMLVRPERRGDALQYLQFSESKAAISVLRAALDTVSDPHLSIRIANALILQGDSYCLSFIKHVFLPGPAIPVDSFQELTLSNAMAYYLKDPDAIPELEDLLGAPSAYIRRGAAGALRGTQSPQALGALVKALDDVDSEVRYWGVVGLAEISGQKDWRPNETLFKSDESRFLSHWKEWARNR